jgi:prepilin-type N-terminal cleavage/methylation domain-containing protein
MRETRSKQGYSLIELMMAVGLMGLLSMAIASSLEGQKRFYNSNERVVEAQEDARLVLDLLKFDARMAGFMVAPVASIASVDGGANLPDRFCVSSTLGFDIPVGGQETSLNQQIERYLVNDTNVTAVLLPNAVRLTSLDIDGTDDDPNAEVNFAPQSGIIISDGTTSHCAAIDVGGVATATNTITLSPQHPMPGGGFSTTNLRRNGTLMSSTIEDMQLEFWAVNTPPANPVHNLNDPVVGLNPSTVSRVRVTVVSTSTQVDTGSTKTFGGGQRPAVANRVAGPQDTTQRRLFTANLMPRNISTQP